MDAELIKRLFPQASASTLRANIENLAKSPRVHFTDSPRVKEGTRIRQSSEPPLNKLEIEWKVILDGLFPNYPRPRAQSRRYKLGNGIWYKPDFVAQSWPQANGPAIETAWEVKGSHAFRGGFENLKVAAATFPEVRWILVWKKDREWFQQIVLP